MLQAAQPWTPHFLLGASFSSSVELGGDKSRPPWGQTAVVLERRNVGERLGTEPGTP